MKSTTFDTLARSLTETPTRRSLLHRVAIAVGIGLADGRRPNGARAKKKNNKPKTNEFGCVSVGKACNGKDRKCCSGICDGKGPKNGKKDKSKCVAHNVGTCQADQDSCAGVEFPCGTDGFSFCVQTTGKASFCGSVLGGTIGASCFDCVKDTDCDPLFFGLGAACVVCGDGSCLETGNKLCFPASP